MGSWKGFAPQEKRNSSTLQYFAKYLGYDISDTIWLDEYELHNALNVLKGYKAT